MPKRKVGAKPARTFAKTKTGPSGNYVLKAVPPGTYKLSIVLVVELTKVEGKSCSVPGFELGLGISGTDKSGRDVRLMLAETRTFAVKAGDVVAKDVVLSCK